MESYSPIKNMEEILSRIRNKQLTYCCYFVTLNVLNEFI